MYTYIWVIEPADAKSLHPPDLSLEPHPFPPCRDIHDGFIQSTSQTIRSFDLLPLFHNAKVISVRQGDDYSYSYPSLRVWPAVPHRQF